VNELGYFAVLVEAANRVCDRYQLPSTYPQNQVAANEKSNAKAA